jgi:hypothetical protein
MKQTNKQTKPCHARKQTASCNNRPRPVRVHKVKYLDQDKMMLVIFSLTTIDCIRLILLSNNIDLALH